MLFKAFVGVRYMAKSLDTETGTSYQVRDKGDIAVYCTMRGRWKLESLCAGEDGRHVTQPM